MTEAGLPPTVGTLRSTREATLAEVYDLDMGHRLADVPLWGESIRRERPLRVVEVGCGTGRIPLALDRYFWLPGDRSLFPSVWVGLDPDPGMISRFEGRTRAAGLSWCSAVCGDARAPKAWDEVLQAAGGPVGLVLVPYSTLYLLPHADQVGALRLAGRTLAHGGLLLVEVFEPTLGGGEATSSKLCHAPDGSRTWARLTTFRVDVGARTTAVERRYGPAGPTGAPTSGLEAYRVAETIYWRRSEDLVGLAEEAGLRSVEVLREGGPLFGVPRGFVVLSGRRF